MNKTITKRLLSLVLLVVMLVGCALPPMPRTPARAAI